MNFIQLFIGVGIMLLSWMGIKFIEEISPGPLLVRVIIPEDGEPVVARTCPHIDCARLDEIWGGEFGVVSPLNYNIDEYGHRWLEMYIFDKKTGWIMFDERTRIIVNTHKSWFIKPLPFF